MNRLASRVCLRVAISTVIACAALTTGCTDDATDNGWVLGPVEAGIEEAAIDQDGAPPIQPGDLIQAPCVGPVLQGGDEVSLVRQVAALQSRLIVTSSSGVDGWQLDAKGCPASRIDAFGNKGHVQIEALSAAPLPGGRALLADGTSTVVIDSVGKLAAICMDATDEVKARWVDADANGHALALAVRSPIGSIVADVTTPETCGAFKFELTPLAYVILAIAHARSGQGVVAAEQQTAYAPIGISRYDADGNRTANASWADTTHPGHLCSVAGLVDTDQGIVVVDDQCKRLVVYDSTALQPTWQANFEATPRGVAFTGDAARVLVPVTRAVADGAQATFVVVNLQ